MAGITAWVLGDQLSAHNQALQRADRVLMIESQAALRARRFHRQKLHLILVAMRTFADELRDRGTEVEVIRAPTMKEGLEQHCRRHKPASVRLMAPKSVTGRQRLSELPKVELVADNMFLSDPEWFAGWARNRRRLVMEDFYRLQRRRLNLLMDGGEPVGGRWNFDTENRRPADTSTVSSGPYRPRETEHDKAVRRELDEANFRMWGEDGPRRWPASRTEARRALRRFIDERLPQFGTYQDAMLRGQRTMWHSLLSSSLNLGLLDPLECAQAAEVAYREERAPLNSVEGFIRQIVGWREYVWCMYWHAQDTWAGANALEAHAPLPAVLETGETNMACLHDAVGGLRRTAYSHHIERLMLYGNLVLLCGTEPDAALDWYHRAFIDGYDWVMAPNVLGMATWADGGRMMTKPYAASGRYINRMSDYCASCAYRPDQRIGEQACPFTTMYWDFLARHQQRLAGNHRMAMPLRNLERIDENELAEIRQRAQALRSNFDA
ncbi:MAG: cryptochrome/photolyase family protein [Actinomycetota bacterium]|nr:cryptochrome/photolyase family protein [Actinomycetota bacterium]